MYSLDVISTRVSAELGEGLLHLGDGAGAVEEAERAGRVGEGVGGDEGDERRRVAGARRHLQGALQLPPVRVRAAPGRSPRSESAPSAHPDRTASRARRRRRAAQGWESPPPGVVSFRWKTRWVGCLELSRPENVAGRQWRGTKRAAGFPSAD